MKKNLFKIRLIFFHSLLSQEKKDLDANVKPMFFERDDFSILGIKYILLQSLQTRFTSLLEGAIRDFLNFEATHGWLHSILLLWEVTWQCRSFLPVGWLKGLCILGSRQQLNNRYWVALKGTICCDQVQLEFEPWTDEDSNVEIYFQIRFHKKEDFVGWLLSFISNHVPSILKEVQESYPRIPTIVTWARDVWRPKFTSEQNKS